MKNEVKHSKWGTSKTNNYGYHQIKSGKEGHHGKLLHRLIFEDYYNINLEEEFPNGVHIHHQDENKLNNEIWNLIPMSPSEHSSLHNKGKNHPLFGNHHSEKTCMKMSKTRNSSRVYRVSKRNDNHCKQGFIWTYEYYDENNNRKAITSVDLDKLKEKVLAKGLEWIKLDEVES